MHGIHYHCLFYIVRICMNGLGNHSRDFLERYIEQMQSKAFVEQQLSALTVNIGTVGVRCWQMETDSR